MWSETIRVSTSRQMMLTATVWHRWNLDAVVRSTS